MASVLQYHLGSTGLIRGRKADQVLCENAWLRSARSLYLHPVYEDKHIQAMIDGIRAAQAYKNSNFSVAARR